MGGKNPDWSAAEIKTLGERIEAGDNLEQQAAAVTLAHGIVRTRAAAACIKAKHFGARKRSATKISRYNSMCRKYKLPPVGSIMNHLTPEQAAWFAANVPEGMSLWDYVLLAIMPDVMEEE